MKNDRKFGWILKAINHFLVFFLMVAFVITCCTLLFISVLSETLAIELTSEIISKAAKLTFLNVLIISLIFTVIDSVRRHVTLTLPAKRIAEATEKMTRGDFTARIKKSSKFASYDQFDAIIDGINKMAEELSGVETLRSDFISNVSHEMNTPLAVMQNYATLLQTPGLSEEKRIEYSKAISDASRRLSDMMTNILKLNRLENQRIYAKNEEFDLSEQICECLLQYENVWEKKAIELQTDIEENVTVCGDAELLSLVWSNLFSNAFKFTENGGTVSVSLSSDEKYAKISVSDTGCGIPENVGKHIFDKFYQGDTSHSTEGNGLGLALVKRIIDITDSDISVKSEIGVGTVFTVKLRRNTNGNI